MTKAAVAAVAKRGRAEMEVLLSENTDDGLQEERNVLRHWAEDKSLEKVGLFSLPSQPQHFNLLIVTCRDTAI